ncbi:MAG: carboxyl transferase domain-containing protein [Emergencia sp.]
MTENNREGMAMERIRQLLDYGSFMEIGEAVTARLTDFYTPGTQDKPSDGVITGYGTIEGRLVYIFSQDAAVLGGTYGEMHGQKVNRLYQLAMKMKAPVIGLLDCHGFRIEEGLDSLDKFARLYALQAEASSRIPQIMAVVGRCGGGMSIAANMADFVFVERENGQLFVNPGNAIDRSFDEIADQADFTDGEMSCGEIQQAIRTIITLLPPNTETRPLQGECSDDLNRLCPDIASVRGDGRAILRQLSDDGFLFEARRDSGRDMITGFIRLDGAVVGAVANHRGKNGSGRITAEGFDKSASFIALCDKFSIPILTVTDTEGFDTSEEQEIYLPKAAGRMIRALAGASVPKVNLITGELYGSAYSLMNSKGLGADYVFMWDTARVNIINPKQAVEILYPQTESAFVEKRAADYEKSHSSARALARHAYVDKVIRPEDTRKYIAGAFETFANLYQTAR